MARRRYLSTMISTDKAVASLVQKGGAISALLYTWMIPHASDDATLPSDPEELLSTLAPILAMRGLVSIEDVEDTVRHCLNLGLLMEVDGGLRFPESFFKHQTYIRGERRGTPQPTTQTEPEEVAPQISAEQRTSPQIIASFKSSSSLSTPLPPGRGNTRRVKPPREPLTDEQRLKIIADFEPKYGGMGECVAEIDAAMNHEARFKTISENLYVRNWLRNTLSRRANLPKTNGYYREPPRTDRPLRIDHS